MHDLQHSIARWAVQGGAWLVWMRCYLVINLKRKKVGVWRESRGVLKRIVRWIADAPQLGFLEAVTDSLSLPIVSAIQFDGIAEHGGTRLGPDQTA